MKQMPDVSSNGRDQKTRGEPFTAAHFSDPILGDLVELLRTKEPGDRMPSERELAARLGVSRTALRDRIGQLEAFGVLERREREGAIYTGLRPEKMGEVLILGLISSEIHVESLSAVRHALEREAAILAATRPDLSGIESMRNALLEMHQSQHGSDIFSADVEFHEGLFVASNSSGLIFLARVLRAVLQGTLRFVTLAEERDMVRQLHSDILAAIDARDPEAARLAIDRHFEQLEVLFEKDARHRALEQ
ncbi:FadR/GntR family transcriptional regulator [Nesterenkonia salmonea]|nr:FCD domain-containing protein [Nesterenkonia salmonea]